METPQLAATQQAPSRYHGNATNSLPHNSNPRHHGNAIQLIATQRELPRYYGNAIWCIDHATKENPTCHNIVVVLRANKNIKQIFSENIK
jgi:hypothetical protein